MSYGKDLLMSETFFKCLKYLQRSFGRIQNPKLPTGNIKALRKEGGGTVNNL